MPSLKIDSPKTGTVIEFACRDSIPPWRLMELSAAAGSRDSMRQMAGFYEFIMAVVLPEERSRFEDAMRDMDDVPDVMDRLNHAIGDLMVEYGNRPTEQPSSLDGGPQKTGLTSRVVSLSRGTGLEEQTSSKGGQSAAS